MNMHVDASRLGGLHLQIVRSPDGLRAITAAWSRLWQDVDGLVFQHPAWVSAWWNALPAHHRYRLRIGLIWHNGNLKAVLPLVIARRKGLRFLEWAAITCTDYPEILASPDCTPGQLQELWASMLDDGGFDIVQLSRLLPDARARAMIAPGRSDGIRLQPGHRTEISCRVVGDYSETGSWLAHQSKKTRQNYRRGRKLLEEGAEVGFRLLDPASEPIAPAVERFYALKRKWLADTDRQSELLETDAAAVRALVDVLAGLGILRIFVLERNGETVAVSINFEQRGTMMAFLTTFDPQYERASPGAVLIMEYIEWSAHRGLETVDFLCGAERFKFRFSTTTVLLESVVGARTLLGHAALLANRLRLRLRPAETEHFAAGDPDAATPSLADQPAA